MLTAIYARASAFGFWSLKYYENAYYPKPYLSIIISRFRQSSSPTFTACQRKGHMVWAESPNKMTLSLKCQSGHSIVPKYPTGFSATCKEILGIF